MNPEPGLDNLRRRVAQLAELKDAISMLRWTVDVARLRPPPPRAVAQAARSEMTMSPPSLTPDEVLAGWTRGRGDWLRGLSARDRRAVLAALLDDQVGGALAQDPTFFAALSLLGLRGRLLDRAAAALCARHFPPHAALRRTLAGADRLPVWWRKMAEPGAFARDVAVRVLADGWPQVQAELALPGRFPSKTWAHAVVRLAEPSSTEDHLRLLRFVDGPKEKVAPSPLQECQRDLVCGLVGVTQPGERARVAQVLRRRVGDVFGVVDEPRWRGIEDQRRIVRGWVANQVLEVIFKHVVPVGMGNYQTRPRQEFWTDYTFRVERLWLLIDDRLRARIQHDEVRHLLQQVGDMIEVRELRGQVEQAVVWMHLRSDTGRVITVIEGNANTSCRISDAEVEPPKRKIVEYSFDVVRARGFEAYTHNPPASSWQHKFRQALIQLQVGPNRSGGA